MVYPTDGNPKMEWLINGTWTDISSYVRAPDGQTAIRITRGRADEQGRTNAQTCGFTLNNRDGRFSNRNPLSPYYGLLPRNTRVRVTAGSTSGETWLRLPMDYGQRLTDEVSTPDLAALDIVGDIEIRADIEPDRWVANVGMMVATKYNITGDQRSWVFYIGKDGKLNFIWSTAGTSGSRLFATSTVALPATTGRLSLKVILDVNNGAAGNTVQFFTASSIDGTYTQLGANVTQSGVTSIFSSSAAVVIGQGQDTAAAINGVTMFRGRFHKLRIYNSSGTVVANPDFTAQAVGATSFNDSATRVWTVAGNSRITSDRLRFFGELSSLPQRWDKSGRDVWVPTDAGGLIRRLTQGVDPLESPMKRVYSLKSLTGYWPMEDGSASTSAGSAVQGARDGTAIGISFDDERTLPGTATAATLSAATSKFILNPATTASTGTSYFTFYFRLTALPVADSCICTLTSTGSARKINIYVGSAGFRFDFVDPFGTVLSTSSASFGSFGGVSYSPNGQWIGMNVLQKTNGGNVDWYARWTNVAAEGFVGIGPTSYAGTVGRLSSVVISAANSSAFVDGAIAQVMTSGTDLDFVSNNLAKAANAYLGELAGTRLLRLAAEEGEAIDVIGQYESTEAMGYQALDTFINLVYDCADVDGGLLGEARDILALQYRTRKDMEHRVSLTLNYSSKHLTSSPEPTDDDQLTANDVTVTRTNGSSARYQIASTESGFLSVESPPTGVGRYSTEVNLNAQLDSRLYQIASWIAHNRSIDESRYASLALSLHRTEIKNDATTFADLIQLNLGDTAYLTNLPSWLPPDQVLMLVQGYTEELGKFLWEFTANTTPARIQDIGVYDYTVETGVSRYDHSTSAVNTGINSTATSMLVKANSSTPSTPDLWTTNAAHFPFDILVGGERMTVTNITGSSSPQTFTVTRSVNGIVKSQVADTRVRLFRPVFYEL